MHSVSRHHDVGGKYSEQDAEAMCIQWRGGDDLLYIHSVQNKSVEWDKIKIKAKKKKVCKNHPEPPVPTTHTHIHAVAGEISGTSKVLEKPGKTNFRTRLINIRT